MPDRDDMGTLVQQIDCDDDERMLRVRSTPADEIVDEAVAAIVMLTNAASERETAAALNVLAMCVTELAGGVGGVLLVQESGGGALIAFRGDREGRAPLLASLRKFADQLESDPKSLGVRERPLRSRLGAVRDD